MAAEPLKPPLDARLDALERELDEVETELADPATASDLTRLRHLSRRHKELGEVVATWRELRRARSDLEDVVAELQVVEHPRDDEPAERLGPLGTRTEPGVVLVHRASRYVPKAPCPRP